MGKFDSAGKEIINRYSQAWSAWVLRTEQIQVLEELSGEFQFFARRNDSLLKVVGQSGEFLSLTELQFVYDKTMDKRMAIYKLLAERQYGLDVFVSVVFFLPPPQDTIVPDSYHRVFMGQETHVDYQVIKIWELDAEAVLQYNDPMLLPFVPLMNNGGSEETVRRCIDKIRELPPSEAAELEGYLAVFASHVLDLSFIRKLLRWEMNIFEESPIIQEFLEQKRIIWEANEKRKATLSFLYETLLLRFSVALGQFDEYFNQLDTDTLRDLWKVAFTAESLDEFLDAVFKKENEEQEGVDALQPA